MGAGSMDRSDKKSGKNQRGATAVEFAFVFTIFLLLFYGILTYGLIFTMRLSLQHAAEEGARAALRYPTLPAGTSSSQALQITLRKTEAERIAATQTAWMDNWGDGVVINARICLLNPDDEDADPAAVPATVNCETAAEVGDCADKLCQVIVTTSYPYGASPVFPTLPGLGLIIPPTMVLKGNARVILEGRALSLI